MYFLRKRIKIISCVLLALFVCQTIPAVTHAGWEGWDEINKVLGIKRVAKEKNERGVAKILGNKQMYQIVDLNCGYREAKLFAERQGGHLAIIDSAYESKLLYDFMISQDYKAAFFGLADLDADGKWEDVNGNVATFTNWHKNQPDLDDGNELYAMLYKRYKKGTWRSAYFSPASKKDFGTAFIIEWDRIFDDEPEYKPEPAYVPSIEERIWMEISSDE